MKLGYTRDARIVDVRAIAQSCGDDFAAPSLRHAPDYPNATVKFNVQLRRAGAALLDRRLSHEVGLVTKRWHDDDPVPLAPGEPVEPIVSGLIGDGSQKATRVVPLKLP